MPTCKAFKADGDRCTNKAKVGGFCNIAAHKAQKKAAQKKAAGDGCGCGPTTKCIRNTCACFEADEPCGDSCNCNSEVCENVEDEEDDDHEHILVRRNDPERQCDICNRHAVIFYSCSLCEYDQCEACNAKLNPPAPRAPAVLGGGAAAAAGSGGDPREDLAGLIAGLSISPPVISPGDLKIDRAGKLGEGGFGAVFKAELNGTRVAVKIGPMSPHDSSDRSKLEALEAESRALVALRHPHCV